MPRAPYAILAALLGLAATSLPVLADPVGDATPLRDAYPVEWVPADSDFGDVSLPFQVDWSLGLRGAYQRDESGTHYEMLALPSVTLTNEWRRARLTATADAEIDKLQGADARIAELRLAVAGDYRIDSDTTLSGNALLSTSQESTLTAPLDEAVPARITTGSIDGTLTRDFGRFTAELRGGIGREVYGDTTLVDGTVRDNADSTNTSGNAGLRLGLKMTPILSVFGDLSVARDVYDAPSSTLGVKADGTDYALKAGIAGNWGHDRLEAEASVGVGLRRYDAASLGDVHTTLYDASVTYHPDETWTIGANLSTEIVPPGGDVDATRIRYALGADLGYRINSWLALRASADLSREDQVGTDITNTSYGWGVGADYTLNSHTDLSADYGFTHIENAPDPERDAHRIVLGVTFKR